MSLELRAPKCAGERIAAASIAGSESSQPNSRVAASATGRLRWGAVWVVLSRSLGVVVTMLVNVVLARWLSPADFGSFLLLSSVLAAASLVAMFGLNTAVVRFVAESLGNQDAARAERVLRLVLSAAAVSIASVAGIFALTLSVANDRFLGLPDFAGLIPLVATSLVLLASLQLLAEACRGLHDIRLASIFSGGQTGGLASNFVFLLLIAAAVVISRPGFATAVALNAVAMLVTLPFAVTGFLWTRRRAFSVAPSAAPSSEVSVHTLLGFSSTMLAIQLLTFATTQADLWIAGVWCPHDQLGLYGAARRLVLLVSLPLQMMNLTVVASVAELFGQGRLFDLEALLRRSALLAAAPTVPVILALLFGGGPILGFLFGDFFRGAAVPLGILAIGQLFLVGVGSAGGTLEMSGNHRASLLVNIVSTAVLIVTGPWAASRYGIAGLAAASAGAIAIQSLALWLLARRIVGVWTHPFLRLPLSAT